MYRIFAKSSRGYSHIQKNKPCQDYSAMYLDNQRALITACDGHGGKVYVRSNDGAQYASNALLNALSSITPSFLKKYKKEDIEEKIKLIILCDWNKQVEEGISFRPLYKKELEGLNEDEICYLKTNPSRAYGTTLSGAVLIKNTLIVVSIGDTECLLIKQGKIEKVFNNDDDPAGNITYSMCQEDAFKYMRVRILDFRPYDGIIIGTDGLTAAYQSYSNFLENFIKPMIKRLKRAHYDREMHSFLDKLAQETGVGDDVTLSYIIKSRIRTKYYK